MSRTSRGSRVAAILAAAALGLSACGGTSNDSGSTSSSAGTQAACDLKIGFMGAETGPAAGLGINIEKGVELALDQYNQDNPDCQVQEEQYDTQGDPTQAGPLARGAVSDDKVIGIVGPAFSGESAAVDPTFAEAGLPTITASATDPTLSEQGWDTFFRILGNDATQGPAAAAYIQDKIKSTKVFVMDDATPYGKGLADQVRDTLGNSVVGNDEVQTGQTDFSASVTAVGASGADTLFYGGYYPEAGPLIKQLRAANWKGTFVTADGVKDPGFVEAAGKAAADGTIITCPCIPPEQASGTFFDDYKAKFHVDPGTYGAEAYDATNVFLAGIKSGIDTRPAMLDFVTNYNAKGVTKDIAWTANGESKDIHVYAYKVENGEIVFQSQIK
ncbi:MAG: branched-chain amino acid ABC transporter substrate-binding protein [Nocardioidaceae bacterium]